MRAPGRPENEAERLAALAAYDILDSPEEDTFDALTEIAASLIGTPIALVSLVDEHRQWFKAHYGLDVRETPRDVSFCGHVVASGRTLVVPDAHADERFHDNPLVTGEPHVGFYVGVPLVNDDGHVLGTLCAVDGTPRELTAAQQRGLELLAGQVVALLELRRKERELVEERRRLRAHAELVEASLDLHALGDVQLRLHHLNPAWERVTGWTVAELDEQPLLEFLHPDDAEAIFREAQRIVAGAPAVEFESRFRHREGHYVWLAWTVSFDHDTFYAVGRDCGVRHAHQEMLRAAEESARASEARLRAVFEAMAEGVAHQDATGGIVDCNDAGCRALGLSREEMLERSSGDPRWRAVDERGAPFPVERFPGVLALGTGEVQRDVLMGVVNRDGEPRWLTLNSVPLRDADDAIVGAVTTFRDITESRRMANELIRERGWLTTLLDNLPGTTVAVFDEGLQLVETFGSTRAVPVPPRVEGVADLGDAMVLRDAATRCLAGEHVRVLTRSDGRQLDMAFVPMFENGVRQGLLLARDVTEREALRDHVARQERQLSMATLAAGVGHEINNPLQAVNTNIDFAIEELRRLAVSMPSSRVVEIVESLDEARRGSERIRAIVRGLRTISRERGPDAPADLGGALELAVSLSQHGLREVATLELGLGALPPVVGDEARIAQALANLLLNAAESFDDRDPTRNRVRVRGRVEADAVVIAVEDNGRGIAPEILPRVFDPFFTTKAPGAGPGLGLAIAHNAVTAMGGTLTCRSVLGAGTRFLVRLRTAQAVEPVAVEPTVAQPHVVVIDDEPAVLQSLRRTLRRDYAVDAFSDAREALAHLLDARSRPVAVLCDLSMPHMDGEQLFVALKEQRPDLAARFVCVTADVGAASSWRSFPKDVVWLEKPFGVAELRAVIDRLRQRSPLVLAS